jgi:hypothetical protein
MVKSNQGESAAAVVVEPVPDAWTDNQIQKYREDTKTLATEIDSGYMRLAERLYQIFDVPCPGDPSGRFLYQIWNFSEIGEYVENELGIHRKKAQRLRGIWYRLGVELSGMDPAIRARIIALGFGKVRELVRVLTVQNAAEWLDRAENSNYETLVNAIRVYLQNLEADRMKAAEEGKDPETVETEVPPAEVKSYTTFALFEEQQKVVDAALTRASELSGSEKPGHNLTLICTDFLATNDFLTGDQKQKLLYLAKLERLLGVRLVVGDPKTSRVTYGIDNLEDFHKWYGTDPSSEDEESSGSSGSSDATGENF